MQQPREVWQTMLLISTGWFAALLWQSLSPHATTVAVMFLMSIFALQLPMLPLRPFRGFLVDMPLDLAEPAAEPAPVLAADSADSAQGGADAPATSKSTSQGSSSQPPLLPRLRGHEYWLI